MFLSIVTPTYNRAYILSECYRSLTKQTCLDFEWIVVDDGSTDNTEELVQSFIDEGKLDIKYVRQENSGKHVAHNTGAKYAQGEMFLCLDSDDQLTENAVEFAKGYWLTNKRDSITGILAKRGNISNKASICGSWPKEVHSATMFDLNNKYRFYGDTALFFKTEILKKEKFIRFAGERFMPETDLYCEIDRYGEMLLVNEVLYLTEYLPDGLTAKYHQLLQKNPLGAAHTYYKLLCMASGMKMKLKYATLVNIYKSLSKNKELLQIRKRRGWLWISAIPARLIRKRFLNKLRGEK